MATAPAPARTPAPPVLPTQPVPATVAGPITGDSYTVESGDTLGSIAVRSGRNWRTLAEINAIRAPYLIYVGEVLHITAPTTAAGSNYVVQPGDWLSKIAASHDDTVADLYQANRSVIGADENLIFPGEVLSIGKHRAPEPAPVGSSTASVTGGGTRVAPTVPATVPLPSVKVLPVPAPTKAPATTPLRRQQVAVVPTPTAAPVVVNASGSAIVAAARQWLGTPYVYGGASRSGVDCSGLVLQVMRSLGISEPHSSAMQSTIGTRISSLAEARPGDLLFFYSPVGHVGIYIGNGQMIAAPQTGDVVKVQTVWTTPTVIRRVE